MGDFVTNSETSLETLSEHCSLLKNVLHDVLRLEVRDKLDDVRYNLNTAVLRILICYRLYDSV